MDFGVPGIPQSLFLRPDNGLRDGSEGKKVQRHINKILILRGRKKKKKRLKSQLKGLRDGIERGEVRDLFN